MLAVLGALLVVACDYNGIPNPTASPSAAATSSAAPSSQASSASTAAAACTGADIRATGGPWGGAAGSRGSDILVENHGSGPCLLPASPTVAVVDAGGAVLISTPAKAGSAGSLAPGAQIGFSLLIGNWCDQGTRLPLRFRLALAADVVDIGNLAVSSIDELPPCNGPGLPPDLSATAWQP